MMFSRQAACSLGLFVSAMLLVGGCSSPESPESLAESRQSVPDLGESQSYIGDDLMFDLLLEAQDVVEQVVPVEADGLPTTQDVAPRRNVSSEVQVAPSRCEVFELDGLSLAVGEKATFTGLGRGTSNPMA